MSSRLHKTALPEQTSRNKNVLDRLTELGVFVDGANTFGNRHCYPARSFDSAVPSSTHLPLHHLNYPTLISTSWPQWRWENSSSDPCNVPFLFAGLVLIRLHSLKEVSTLKPALLKSPSASKCPSPSQQRPHPQNIDPSTIPPTKPTRNSYSPTLRDMGSYGTTLSTASSSHKT